MAILTELNLLGQQRLDVPHVRLIEAGVRGDFDALAGKMLGDKLPLILSGFKLTNISVGSAANQIQVIVANGSLINYNATESGSILSIPADRANEVLSGSNANVSGGFTSNAVNYIGIDFVRTADSSTTDTVQFLNASSLQESPREVPLRRTLNYKIVISTTDFTSQPNLVPLAKIQTDAANNVVSTEDVRPIMFRLGSGGDVANNQYSFPWPGGRYENTSGDVFSNGDKEIGAMKPWMDSVMTRLWELGGGEYWYSATADRNVQLVWSGSAFSNGENFEWSGTNLHWKGLRITFDNSTGYYNDIADQLTDLTDLTDLDDGDCIYVDLDRTQNLTGLTALVAAKSPVSTLGPGSPPGSRWILARRVGSDVFIAGWKYPVGSWIAVATATSTGIVKLSRAATTPSSPIVISDTGGTITGASGVTALIVTGAASRTAVQGTGGNSTSTAGSGVFGTGGNGTFNTAVSGNGITGVGGNSESPSTQRGGHGGHFTGGEGNGSVLGRRSGHGVYALGGQGGSGTFAGNGVVGLGKGWDDSTPDLTVFDTTAPVAGGNGGLFVGGTSEAAVNAASWRCIGTIGSGGINNDYSGGSSGGGTSSPLPTPGAGVVGVGGGGTYGGPGGQFFGTVTGRSGVVAFGANSNSATAGAEGVMSTGGSNSSTGTSGPGGNFVGGTANSGAAGAGVVGTGGNSTSGTDGYGGLFTAGGTQTIGCAVPATNDFGYTSIRTYYKWITAEQMAIGSGNYGVLDNASTGYVSNAAGDDIVVGARVDLPAGSTITGVGIAAWNDTGANNDFEIILRSFVESAGVILADGAATTTIVTTNDTVSSPKNGTIHNGLTGLSVSIPSGQVSTGTQCYSVGVNSQTAASSDTLRLLGIRITYTMTTLNPDV